MLMSIRDELSAAVKGPDILQTCIKKSNTILILSKAIWKFVKPWSLCQNETNKVAQKELNGKLFPATIENFLCVHRVSVQF